MSRLIDFETYANNMNFFCKKITCDRSFNWDSGELIYCDLQKKLTCNYCTNCKIALIVLASYKSGSENYVKSMYLSYME